MQRSRLNATFSAVVAVGWALSFSVADMFFLPLSQDEIQSHRRSAGAPKPTQSAKRKSAFGPTPFLASIALNSLLGKSGPEVTR